MFCRGIEEVFPDILTEAKIIPIPEKENSVIETLRPRDSNK